MTTTLESVALGGSTSKSCERLSRVRAVANPRQLVGDSLLALILTGFALAGAVRLHDPSAVFAGTLSCVGTACLAWRRIAPMPVLIIAAGTFSLYQLLGYPRISLPYAVLVALYSVASLRMARVAAIASSALVISALGESLRSGSSPSILDLDDLLVAYLLSVGAACALGYGVQLRRTRTRFMGEQAARLASEHAAHEQLVLHQERERIARELHDSVAHQVSLITALAAGAQRVLPAEPERAQQALASIELAGREALTEMRMFLRVLRTDEKGDVAGQPNLERLPELVSRTDGAGLPVQLRLEGPPRPLPASVEATAYRIVQEALTNTLKHAGPSHARVTLRYEPRSLRIQICDDGRGMASDPVAGHGLIGMRERARLLGGSLTVGPGSTSGVWVDAYLPVDEDPR
jgi:signal transduction histidine kinase